MLLLCFKLPAYKLNLRFMSSCDIQVELDDDAFTSRLDRSSNGVTILHKQFSNKCYRCLGIIVTSFNYHHANKIDDCTVSLTPKSYVMTCIDASCLTRPTNCSYRCDYCTLVSTISQPYLSKWSPHPRHLSIQGKLTSAMHDVYN